MKKITEVVGGIIALLFIVGIGYLLYKIIIIVFLNFNKIDINIFVAIIGGTITITSFFITRYLERKKTIELEIRNKKIPIYEEFFEFYFSIIFKSNTDEEITTDQMVKFFQQFNQKAIIWFPDNILKSYIEWKQNLTNFSNNQGVSLRDIILHQEQFMSQIRKDIGHTNKNLALGDISSLYINDFDTLQ
ncbi:hypothetical protein JET18_08985 [Chryseobacterium sp. L7]|uniref:Uncharacterized protein n=1 Tax=Chryseobacterium endalhagicum TaxID=2797638 RepID=A0ABS1QEE9_9FLAO|nr:hypothetical protein [Chryseobacterium endalhagicum]MBL1220970.1 hypothetical protein [Chryseobacterium endalhagicum]